MGSAERREREKAELREKILTAARELFVSHGLDNVTMRKIAEHIEYSPTAIYAHFPDKDSLLLAVCDHDFSELLVEAAPILELADPIERLARAANVFIEFALRHPAQYQFMFMTTGSGPGPSPASVAVYDVCRDTMAQAIRERRVRPEYTDVELLTQAFWSSLHGVASLHIADRFQAPIPSNDPRDLAALVVEIALRGMLRPVANVSASVPKGKAAANAPARSKRRRAARR